MINFQAATAKPASARPEPAEAPGSWWRPLEGEATEGRFGGK